MPSMREPGPSSGRSRSGSLFTATPLVSGSSLWVAPLASGRVYKLNAATGAVECAVKEVGSIQSSPVVATLPGGQTVVYFATLDTGATDGSIYAIDTDSCATVFTWSGKSAFSSQAGIWSPISYGVDAEGVPLVLFGSADPDSSEYAINAATGSLVWRYYTNNPPGEDWDVGAGSTISAPGVNGFADGVAYFDGKDGVFYALDLTTGALIWSWDFGNGANTDALSTPALDGSTLVFGDKGGVSALDADNGKALWHYSTGGDTVNSSSAIVGPPGQQVVVFGTLGGVVHVVSLATGASLYSYPTGSFITASPADFDGTLLVDSADGFLYDFGLGGGNGAAPTTAVTAPANGSTVPYPSGELDISGTATAPHGVKAVSVEVQEDGTSGPWYEATTNNFTPGLSSTDATMGSPGATSTTWSLSVPVPEQGASYLVDAAAVDEDGIADISSDSGNPTPSASSFSVSASPECAGRHAGRPVGPPGESAHRLGQRVRGGGAGDVHPSGQRRRLGGARDRNGNGEWIGRTGHGYRALQRVVRTANRDGDWRLLGPSRSRSRDDLEQRPATRVRSAAAGLRGQRRGHLQTPGDRRVLLQPGLGGDRGSGDIRPAGGRRRGRLLRRLGRRRPCHHGVRRHEQLGGPDWEQHHVDAGS